MLANINAYVDHPVGSYRAFYTLPRGRRWRVVALTFAADQNVANLYLIDGQNTIVNLKSFNANTSYNSELIDPPLIIEGGFSLGTYNAGAAAFTTFTGAIWLEPA